MVYVKSALRGTRGSYSGCFVLQWQLPRRFEDLEMTTFRVVQGKVLCVNKTWWRCTVGCKSLFSGISSSVCAHGWSRCFLLLHSIRVLSALHLSRPWCCFSQIARVVGMLAEQEAASVVGKSRAGELRDALVDVTEMLRAETEAAVPQHEEPQTVVPGGDVAQAKVSSLSAIAFGYTRKLLMAGTTVNGFGLFRAVWGGDVYVGEIRSRRKHDEIHNYLLPPALL